LNFHERDEAVGFGFARYEFGKDAAEPQRVFTKRRAHPIIARGRRVALVENEIDDFERFARTMRCATVGSGTRNARAISGVVNPPSSRNVNATRASVESTG
jgi:hypothetical protein